jgi:hypothetical protein
MQEQYYSLYNELIKKGHITAIWYEENENMIAFTKMRNFVDTNEIFNDAQFAINGQILPKKMVSMQKQHKFHVSQLHITTKAREPRIGV